MILCNNKALQMDLFDADAQIGRLPRRSCYTDDVLTIGAGTSGLFAAAELARHGVRTRLIGRRWSNLIEVSHNPSVDPARERSPAGGVVMVRPDGHIGFRFPVSDGGR